MSGSHKSSRHFGLQDIYCILIEASSIKKEDATVKARVPLLRSKAHPSKKRKDTDLVGSETFPLLLEFKEVMQHSQMGIEQMSRAYTEKLAEIEDLKKIVVAKTKMMEKEADEHAAQLEELKVKYSKELEDIKEEHAQSMEDLLFNIKKDAGVAIIDARIKMAEEAFSKGLDKPTWNVGSWKKARAKLVSEDPVVEEKEVEASKSGGDVTMEVTNVEMRFTEA